MSGERGSAELRILEALHQLLKLSRTFEPTNKVFVAPLEALSTCANAILEDGSGVEVRLEERATYVNRWPLRLDAAMHKKAIELRAYLAALGIGGVGFDQQLVATSLRSILVAFAMAKGTKTPQDAFTRIDQGLKILRLGDTVRVISTQQIEATSMLGADVDASEGARARRVYARAFGTLRGTFDQLDDARSREVLLTRLRRAVQRLADLLTQDPDRALALAALGGLGDSFVEHGLGTTILTLALARTEGMNRAALADLGVAAALHCLGRRSLPVKQRVPGGEDEDMEAARLTPFHALRDMIVERRLDASLATSLVVSYEHTIPAGYPDADDERTPLLPSRLVAVAHAYDGLLRREGPPASLREMLGTFTYDPRILLRLAGLLGPLPPGTLVVLEDGQTAAVARANPAEPLSPRVRILEEDASAVLDLSRSGTPEIVQHLTLPPGAALSPFVFT